MKFLFLLSLLFTFFISTSGPDVTTQNVLYHSNKRTDTSTGLVTIDLNRILIKSKTKLEWQDGHSAVKYAFDIKSVTGSLGLDNSGAITYQVASEKVNGRFTVKKNNAVIKINAILVADGKPMIVEFDIASYNVLD